MYDFNYNKSEVIPFSDHSILLARQLREEWLIVFHSSEQEVHRGGRCLRRLVT